jgi:ParB family chromosome partitioning protein
MTSGSFKLVPVSSIAIERGDRQRRELTKIEELADSIDRVGLINPIIITRENILVAGERRLTAVRSLGHESIAVQYVDELDESHLHAIELEENIKRVDLPWQDQVKALQDYHKLRQAENPEWGQGDTAKAIGLARNTVSEYLAVARELPKNAKIAEAPKFSVAKGIVTRSNERAQATAIEAVRTMTGAPTPVKPVEPESIINTSFLEWAPTYSGTRFNFIHCDFPYGINAGDFNQGSAAAHGGYDDSEDNYWNLCKTLCGYLDRIATPSAHLMFWFSMKHYQKTLDFFEANSDFTINPFPLIWMKSDNVGILPDPSRGPRQIYETAFHARRGDRKVVQAVANAYSGPTVRDRHMSEKPEDMLRHFFRMYVDNNSVVLDPTCGSGSAIRAAELGGARLAIGLELDPEYCQRARLALRQSRNRKETTNV